MTALEAEALSRMVSETLDTGEAGVEKAAEAGEWRRGRIGRRVEKRQQRQSGESGVDSEAVEANIPRLSAVRIKRRRFCPKMEVFTVDSDCESLEGTGSC